ncbi:ATP-dependent Clp protease, ATP-binding subunit clpA [gut metagenome]|uniref:ATP-dependent Clp protease, ATP-binding subunit clpA n=1 Tax=gut metagenome TaxID=749906 RepID=J9GUA7_9ZZZZ
MKLCDARIHGENGLMQTHEVEGVPVLSAQAEALEIVQTPSDQKPGETVLTIKAPKDGQFGGIDEEELLKMLKERMAAIENGPMGDVIKKLANNMGHLAIVQGKPVDSTTLPNEKAEAAEDAEPSETQSSSSRKLSAEERKLLSFTRDLTAAAERGEIDALIGREKEMERLFEILCCRRKNKPLVIGESGTGKTALIEGLALKIAHGEVPPFLREKRIYVLNAGTLVSRYRGMFSSQLEQIAKSLKSLKNAILFIDDIHVLVDGNGEGGAEQLNALQRLVSDDSLRMIASTSFKPWRSTLSNNEAIARRFHPLSSVRFLKRKPRKFCRGWRRSTKNTIMCISPRAWWNGWYRSRTATSWIVRCRKKP